MAKEKYNKSYQEIIEMICQCLGYTKGDKFNTFIVKKLKTLRKDYEDEVIYETIKNEGWRISNKKFDTEYHKISYFFAIINNNIFHYSIIYMQKKNMNEKIKQQNEKNFIEEDIAIITNNKQTIENSRDISFLLEDIND